MKETNFGEQASQAVLAVLRDQPLKGGELFVVGCSSSEVRGGTIGKQSNEAVGLDIAEAVLKILEDKGLFLAAQCCEHLNRALVVERAAAERYGCEIVYAVPKVFAGGAFAAGAYRHMYDPVLVEAVQGHYGLDIGQTMIGMHLRPVVIPLRIKPVRIGEAVVTGARTRAKLIGGPRAQYE